MCVWIEVQDRAGFGKTRVQSTRQKLDWLSPV